MVNITNSNFDNNSVRYTQSLGGAIFSERNYILINSSNLTSNTANYGGAVYVEYTLDVKNSNFALNTATQGGGNIF